MAVAQMVNTSYMFTTESYLEYVDLSWYVIFVRKKHQLYFLRVGFSLVFEILIIVNLIIYSLNMFPHNILELSEDIGKKTPAYYP